MTEGLASLCEKAGLVLAGLEVGNFVDLIRGSATWQNFWIGEGLTHKDGKPEECKAAHQGLDRGSY